MPKACSSRAFLSGVHRRWEVDLTGANQDVLYCFFQILAYGARHSRRVSGAVVSDVVSVVSDSRNIKVYFAPAECEMSVSRNAKCNLARNFARSFARNSKSEPYIHRCIHRCETGHFAFRSCETGHFAVLTTGIRPYARCQSQFTITIHLR